VLQIVFFLTGLQPRASYRSTRFLHNMARPWICLREKNNCCNKCKYPSDSMVYTILQIAKQYLAEGWRQITTMIVNKTVSYLYL